MWYALDLCVRILVWVTIQYCAQSSNQCAELEPVKIATNGGLSRLLCAVLPVQSRSHYHSEMALLVILL